MSKETTFTSTPPESRQPISDFLLSQFSEFVAAQMGLFFPMERRRNLEQGIYSAARELGFKDAESFIQQFMSSTLTQSQVEILASHLTTGETYFFRDKIFTVIEEHILPELINSRRKSEQRLRIWSAGCCTGEEPYSIAIVLSKMIHNIKNWNITILATDINPCFLKKAAEGIYTEWSFRDTPLWVKEGYFKRKKGGHYEIFPDIKKMVTFSYLNLAKDNYPSLLNNTNAMDIIFCRNVLMYFAPELAKNVIQNLYRCNVDGGYLIVSSVEISHILFSQFMAVNFNNSTLYKKDSKKLQKAEPFPCKMEEEEKVLFQPPPDFVAQPEAFTFPHEFKESIPPEAEQQKTAEPHLIQYMDALKLFEQGRYDESAEKIEVLLSLKQDDAKAMALLAQVYANQGQLSEALDWCEKAIVADKLNPCCHYLLGTILQERGQVQKAVASLKRSLYLNPDFVLAHFALGNLTKQQGKLKESEKHFENALNLLHNYRNEEILPESEGVTAGRLKEIIKSTVMEETFV